MLNMNHDVVISIEILNSDLNLMKQFGIGRQFTLELQWFILHIHILLFKRQVIIYI